MGPEPFTAQVLDDLRLRLARTRWPDPLPYPGWAAGADIGYLKELLAYWTDGFDWRAAERRLNSSAQFNHRHRRAAGALRARAGSRPGPVPAGTDPRVAELVRRAAQAGAAADRPGRHGGDARDSFDVVIPSLLLSGPGRAGGGHRPRLAGLWAKLMTQCLGYARFGAQGQDIGAAVSIALAPLPS